MSQYAIFIQEGFGADAQSVYFTKEPPSYETVVIPLVVVMPNGEKFPTGREREETFCVFTPLNGPYRMRGKENCVPLQRLLSVVEQTNGESDTDRALRNEIDEPREDDNV